MTSDATMIACPNCEKKYLRKPELLNQRVRCGGCQKTFLFGEPKTSEADLPFDFSMSEDLPAASGFDDKPAENLRSRTLSPAIFPPQPARAANAPRPIAQREPSEAMSYFKRGFFAAIGACLGILVFNVTLSAIAFVLMVLFWLVIFLLAALGIAGAAASG